MEYPINKILLIISAIGIQKAVCTPLSLVQDDDECAFYHDSVCYKFLQTAVNFEDAHENCVDVLGEPVRVDSSDLAMKVGEAMERLDVDYVWTEGSLDYDHDWRWVYDYTPFAYQGCYYDQDDDPSLFIQATDNMQRYLSTPASCRNFCRNQNQIYASLQFPNRPSSSTPICRCGYDYEKHGKAPETECRRPCPRDGPSSSRHPTCGGVGYQAVYQVQGSNFVDWYQGPQDVLNSSTGDCVVITADGWLYQNCNTRAAHICEYDYPGRACILHSNLLWTGHKCISLHTDNKTWHAARHACLSEGGDLLTIKTSSNDYFKFRDDFVSGSGEQWWIGLTNRHWLWLSDYEDMSLTEDLWALRRPRFEEENPERTCVAAKRITDSAGQSTVRWMERKCQVKFPVLCTIGVLSSGAGSGWEPDESGSGSGSGWTDGSSTTIPTTGYPTGPISVSTESSVSGPSTTLSTSNSTTTNVGNLASSRQTLFITGVASGVAGAIIVVIIIVVVVCVCKRCRNRTNGMDSLPNNNLKGNHGSTPRSNGLSDDRINNPIYCTPQIHTAENRQSNIYESLSGDEMTKYDDMVSTFRSASPANGHLKPDQPTGAMPTDHVYTPDYAVYDDVIPQTTVTPVPSAPPAEPQSEGIPKGRLASKSSGDYINDHHYLTLTDDSVPL